MNVAGVVGGDDGEDIPFAIETHLVDADLAVEAVDGVGIVVAVIDDVVMSVLLDDAMMSRTVDGAVGIGLQDAALVFKGSHGPGLRDGILHAVGVGMTGTGGIGEVICITTSEHKGRFEDIFQLRIGNQALL